MQKWCHHETLIFKLKTCVTNWRCAFEKTWVFTSQRLADERYYVALWGMWDPEYLELDPY